MANGTHNWDDAQPADRDSLGVPAAGCFIAHRPISSQVAEVLDRARCELQRIAVRQRRPSKVLDLANVALVELRSRIARRKPR